MMREPDLYFVIPTYRLRDVGETVEHYDEHFWRNGHSPTIVVFDDSSPAAQEKYYPSLEQTRTHAELFYVGPSEKEQFIGYLSRRLRDKRLDGLVKNLFRPSYGGNRNHALMYTLGGLMVSSDDDMRPYALMAEDRESLNEGEMSRGRLYRAGRNGYVRKSFDILGSFLDVLGKGVAEVPDNYERGDVLVDTAMDTGDERNQGPGTRELPVPPAGQKCRPTPWSSSPRPFAPGPTTVGNVPPRAAGVNLGRPAAADPRGKLAGNGLPRHASRHAHVPRGPGTYLAFLGRVSPEKGLEKAVEIARRAGMPLRVAAKIYPEERPYYEQVIEPLFRASRWVEFVGEVGGARRMPSSAVPMPCCSRSSGPSRSVW